MLHLLAYNDSLLIVVSNLIIYNILSIKFFIVCFQNFKRTNNINDQIDNQLDVVFNNKSLLGST